MHKMQRSILLVIQCADAQMRRSESIVPDLQRIQWGLLHLYGGVFAERGQLHPSDEPGH